MRKKRDPESDEHRTERLEKRTQERIVQASAEDKAVDAAVRQSIKLYSLIGPSSGCSGETKDET
jgi:hypothetical protein